MCTRQIIPLESKTNLKLLGLLKKYSIDSSSGFATQNTKPDPCTWGTALAYITGVTAATDIVNSNLDTNNIIDRIKRASEIVKMDKNKYQVALSFSGQQRDIARKIYDELTDRGYDVFYDEEYTHEVVGKKLTIFLPKVYKDESEYVVIIASKDYIKSDYAYDIEWGSILSRQVDEEDANDLDAIIYKVDDVELKGLDPDVAYVDADRYSVDEFIDIIDKKIRY